MIAEFRQFLMRGNILELAVAFVLGIAFAAVITTFTDGILMPIIAAIVGKPDFDDVTISIGDAEILVGTFLTALLNFVIVAFALFLILKAVKAAMREKPEEAAAPSDEVVLLTEIRDALRGRA